MYNLHNSMLFLHKNYGVLFLHTIYTPGQKNPPPAEIAHFHLKIANWSFPILKIFLATTIQVYMCTLILASPLSIMLTELKKSLHEYVLKWRQKCSILRKFCNVWAPFWLRISFLNFYFEVEMSEWCLLTILVHRMMIYLQQCYQSWP